MFSTARESNPKSVLPYQSEIDSSSKMSSGATSVLNLPGDCFTKIFLSSPRDACISSTISQTFRSLADSDDIWQHFLPSDYQEILGRSVLPVPYSSKKELYFRLCDSILIDGGTKRFSLDRCTGKKCYLLGARELSIVWGDDRRFWKWKSHPRSQFSKVAVLKYVWWLDIHGKMDTSMLSPRTTYAAYLVVSYDKDKSPWDGLDVRPAEVSVEVGSSNRASKSMARLCREGEGMSFEPLISNDVLNVPRDRGDGWMEIELGEFYNLDGKDGEVKMSLKEVDCSYCKESLIIEGIELRPKY